MANLAILMVVQRRVPWADRREWWRELEILVVASCWRRLLSEIAKGTRDESQRESSSPPSYRMCFPAPPHHSRLHLHLPRLLHHTLHRLLPHLLLLHLPQTLRHHPGPMIHLPPHPLLHRRLPAADRPRRQGRQGDFLR